MTVTSFEFLLLITLGAIIYYVIPKKLQWMELLLLSLIFYFLAANPLTISYLIIVTAIAYISTLAIDFFRKDNEKAKYSYSLAIISIVLIILIWFVVKGRGLWYPVIVRILRIVNPLYVDKLDGFQLISALGMGYYTLQVLGYIIDCYWENVKPQKNPFKLFLFVAYFPQLTTGPISRYYNLESLYEPHSFDYSRICFGAQRILWGFFKKIVIAERVGVIVSGIMGDPEGYYGLYSWIAVLLYPIQMYTDFSGCMDIVLGTSEIFGISLAENFNNPFFARTSQEFWQRWHITLGTWAKDYVLFPLLKCPSMVKFGKYTRKKFGRIWGGFIKNCVGMFCLWMVMGMWHGGYRYIVGVSLWYWIILMLGNLLMPISTNISQKLEIKTESFGWHLFQSIRTYFIYAIGAVFFTSGVQKGLSVIKDCADTIFVKGYANPWVLFDESILNLGIEFKDINIIVFGIIVLAIVGVLREKYGYARNWMKQQPFLFRWFVWILLFGIILIFGQYGPGYDATTFIYQGF